MLQNDKALVVGGGIIGLCSALALQRRGEQVILLDPERETPPASYGNAGHIAIEQAEPIASLATLRSMPRRLMLLGGPVSLPPSQIGRWLPFGLKLAEAARPERFTAGKAALGPLLAEAMPAWRRLSDSLDTSGLLLERGHAVVWHGEAAAKAGLRSWQSADIGTARFHAASREEIAWLARVMRTAPAGGIVFENTGQVADPAAVLTALDTAFCQAGGERLKGEARGIGIAGGAAELVLADGARICPRHLVVAAGVESGTLVEPLGLKAPIIAERGYHIQSPAHDWPDDLPPIVFEERAMIVSRFRSGLRASSFVEFSRRDAPADRRKWARLEAHATALGLPAQAPWQQWLGSRPTLPDYLPAIGRAEGTPNLFYAFGHNHLGLTLGPVTGELVAAMIGGKEAAVPLAPFDLRRFG